MGEQVHCSVDVRNMIVMKNNPAIGCVTFPAKEQEPCSSFLCHSAVGQLKYTCIRYNVESHVKVVSESAVDYANIGLRESFKNPNGMVIVSKRIATYQYSVTTLASIQSPALVSFEGRGLNAKISHSHMEVEVVIGTVFEPTLGDRVRSQP